MAMMANIRIAEENDLTAVNQVIESAVMAWPLAERLKRLSLSLLKYNQQDMLHHECFVAESEQRAIGIASWDPDHEIGLFHGLYVAPEHQGQGLGKDLMARVFASAKAQGRESMLIRAERVSASYFEQLNFEKVETGESEYPYQFLKRL